jgi:hypothetical protein
MVAISYAEMFGTHPQHYTVEQPRAGVSNIFDMRAKYDFA